MVINGLLGEPIKKMIFQSHEKINHLPLWVNDNTYICNKSMIFLAIFTSLCCWPITWYYDIIKRQGTWIQVWPPLLRIIVTDRGNSTSRVHKKVHRLVILLSILLFPPNKTIVIILGKVEEALNNQTISKSWLSYNMLLEKLKLNNLIQVLFKEQEK